MRKKYLIFLGFLFLFLGAAVSGFFLYGKISNFVAAPMVQKSNSQEMIRVASITWCGHEYALDEWQKVKGTKFFLQGECLPGSD